ncbi:ArsR/SmtB family transcription factor [Paenisporosarcina indica]|uniref:ArsR/SmtB family transcription factor n=1 Tax=Paenisporosarcina indica TaxID=650093 RepID=UPI00094FEC35|nr:metalloregulator ArsR/SmtB family transcription factor [Paenisporosarcina indica]
MTSSAKYDVFQAIADPTRRAVLHMLTKEELPISKITAHFPMSRTAIAKHLHILSEAQLVSGRKVGREKIYRLQPEPLEELQHWLSYYEQFWTNKLSLLKYMLENEVESEAKVINSKTDQ